MNTKKEKKNEAIDREAEKIAAQYDSNCQETIQRVKDLLPNKWEVMHEIINIFHWVGTNKELNKSEKIRATVFMKLSGGSEILGVFTVGEIRKVIAKKRLGTDFLNKLLTQIKNLQKISDYIDKFNKVLQVIYSWVRIKQFEPNGEQAKNLERTARQRMSDIERAYEQMSLLMDIVEAINSFAPKGIKNYINLQIKFFKRLKGTMNICKNHSLRILQLLSEIESDWDKALKDKNSWWNLH